MFGFDFRGFRIWFHRFRIDSDLFGLSKLKLIVSSKLILFKIKNVTSNSKIDIYD
jgi:hypothetical protein